MSFCAIQLEAIITMAKAALQDPDLNEPGRVLVRDILTEAQEQKAVLEAQPPSPTKRVN
jgi:hypothetical protein